MELPPASFIASDLLSSFRITEIPLRVLRLLILLFDPPPLPVVPLNRLPITYGLAGSPWRKPRRTWSPTSGINTKPRLLFTSLLLPPSGVITRTQPVCIPSVCQFMRTRTRPLPSGSALLSTVAICVSANGIRTFGLGNAFIVAGIALKRFL